MELSTWDRSLLYCDDCSFCSLSGLDTKRTPILGVCRADRTADFRFAIALPDRHLSG